MQTSCIPSAVHSCIDICQCNRETVLDYKPWLYAAESIFVPVCVGRTFQIASSCISDAILKLKHLPKRRRRPETWQGDAVQVSAQVSESLHTVSFNMAKMNDCLLFISNVFFLCKK